MKLSFRNIISGIVLLLVIVIFPSRPVFVRRISEKRSDYFGIEGIWEFLG